MQTVAQMIKRVRKQPTALTAVHIGYRQWVCLRARRCGIDAAFQKTSVPVQNSRCAAYLAVTNGHIAIDIR